MVPLAFEIIEVKLLHVYREFDYCLCKRYHYFSANLFKKSPFSGRASLGGLWEKLRIMDTNEAVRTTRKHFIFENSLRPNYLASIINTKAALATETAGGTFFPPNFEMSSATLMKSEFQDNYEMIQYRSYIVYDI